LSLELFLNRPKGNFGYGEACAGFFELLLSNFQKVRQHGPVPQGFIRGLLYKDIACLPARL
jgi:hypothetical protein